MLLGKLDQHCGNCGIIDYCVTESGYSICKDARFMFVQVEAFKAIAEKCSSESLESCKGCQRPDCGVYRHSETDYSDEVCEHSEEEKESRTRQTADYVYSQLPEVQCAKCGEMSKETTIADDKPCCARCYENFSNHCEECGKDTLLGTTEVRGFDAEPRDVCKKCMESYHCCPKGNCDEYVHIYSMDCDSCEILGK